MPFVFLVFGLLFLVIAVRGTQSAAFKLLASEFSGPNSFVPWAAAILILGAIGYARPLRKPADAMIGLVFLGMILTNKGGFFSQLNAAIRNPVAPAPDAGAAPVSLNTPQDNILFNQQNMPAGAPMLPYAPPGGGPTVQEPPAQSAPNWWQSWFGRGFFGANPAY
jgi:hypothetical protein